MSRVSSNSARRARSVAVAPAAGFRPAGAALAVAAAFVLQPGMLHAQPSGAQVIHGHAGFASNGNNLVITTLNGAGTNHSAINWQSFSIPAGSMTQFIQPSATSTSINRVLGNNPSAIFGTLRSNGKLVLVNPAGITVGAGAVVDTARFTASTLKMTDADALAGRLNFAGDAGGLLQVDGRIVARNGDVVLIGPQVQVGAGAVVESIGGATVLAAGQKVAITGRGLEGIHLEVQAGNEARNLGTLQGDAVGMFAHTLRHSGMIEAQAATTEGGRVVLKAMGGDAMVDGAIKAAASGGRGGQLDVLGHRVGLLAGASIDASGANGGGQVRIGGDYQGANPDVPNAAFTYVDAAARIHADATEQGNGGRVIVWADDATRMHGQISARGGALGGDGGFAEVSGRQYLEFTGRADLRAPNGATGTLLLDPNDIVIEVLGPTGTTVGPVFGGGTGQSKIKESDLEAQLAASSVLVATGSGSGGTGRITIANGVNIQWTTSNAFGLQADADIDLQGSISGGANSEVSLRAFAGGVVQNAATSTVTTGSLKIEAVGGGVSMDGANMVDRLAGAASGAGNNFSFTNGKDLKIATVGTPYGAALSGIKANDGSNFGAVDVKVTSGNLEVAHDFTASPDPVATPTLDGGSVRLQASNGNVTLTGANVQAQAGSVDVMAKGSVLGNGTLGTRGSTTADGLGAAVNVTATTGAVSLSAIDASAFFGPNGGKVNVNAAGTISAGSIASTGSGGKGGQVVVNSSGAGIFIGTVDTRGGGGTNGYDGGAVTLAAKTNIVISEIDASGGSADGGTIAGNGGKVMLTAGGNIVLTPSFVAIQSIGGDSAGQGGAGGRVELRAGGNILLQPAPVMAGVALSAAVVTSYASVLSQGGNGNVAGMGGNILAQAGGNIDAGVIFSSGGMAFGGGQPGGKGGDISLSLGGSLTNTTVVTTGGEGYSASNGGTGGTAGNIKVERVGGALVMDSTVMLAAVGGQGGSASEGTGGAGGAGGAIDLLASGGPVVLRSPQILAVGGDGGMNPDDSIGGASGAMGNFTAMGSSVEVEGDFGLNAIWNNSSNVHIRGSSDVSGPGVFRNLSDVTLYDTASLNPSGGIENLGRLRSFGSATSANLQNNAGLVEVVAGSTLWAPSFTSNSGIVQVDGTLEVGTSSRVISPPPTCSICEIQAAAITSGMVFNNLAGGMLSGNGSIVVDGGSGTVDNFGTIAPGGSGATGTFSIFGNLLMQSGSTIATDVLNTSSYDAVAVSGTAITGGSYAVTYLPGAFFAAGDTFNVLRAGVLHATTLPTVNVPQLVSQPSGNDLLLVAAAAVPAVTSPPPPPPVPLAEQEVAEQEVTSQVVTFANLFVQQAQQQQEDEAKDNEIGKDDIVVTDTACKPS
jgi:filamentous hemagglutinin family protein